MKRNKKEKKSYPIVFKYFIFLIVTICIILMFQLITLLKQMVFISYPDSTLSTVKGVLQELSVEKFPEHFVIDKYIIDVPSNASMRDEQYGVFSINADSEIVVGEFSGNLNDSILSMVCALDHTNATGTNKVFEISKNGKGYIGEFDSYYYAGCVKVDGVRKAHVVGYSININNRQLLVFGIRQKADSASLRALKKYIDEELSTLKSVSRNNSAAAPSNQQTLNNTVSEDTTKSDVKRFNGHYEYNTGNYISGNESSNAKLNDELLAPLYMKRIPEQYKTTNDVFYQKNIDKSYKKMRLTFYYTEIQIDMSDALLLDPEGKYHNPISLDTNVPGELVFFVRNSVPGTYYVTCKSDALGTVFIEVLEEEDYEQQQRELMEGEGNEAFDPNEDFSFDELN